MVPTGQTITLAPEVQDFVNKQLGLSNNLADRTTAQLSNLPTGTFDPSTAVGDTSSIAKETYARQLGLLQPQMDDAKAKLTQSLADRGIPVGSEVWNQEQNRYDQAQGQTLTGLSQDADLASTTEQQRQLGNAVTARELPFQELAALQGATPAVQQPSFATQVPSSIAGTDVSGNVWNAYNAATNASQASNSGTAGLLGGVGTLLGGMK